MLLINEKSAAQDDSSSLVVWLLDTEQIPASANTSSWWRIRAGLSNGEILTADRFTHSEACLRYLGARMLVRHALAHVTPCEPQELVFTSDNLGKPYVIAPPVATKWFFNLSHSGRLIACVVRDRPVGIDVESQNRELAGLLHSNFLFTENEVKWITSRAERIKQRATALWTLKEAYLKAIGLGLSFPMADVRFRQHKCQFNVYPNAAVTSLDWYCRLLSPFPNYWLAISGKGPLVKPRINWMCCEENAQFI